ncbi:hypothetical protein RJT34_25963 [Clitoria ternatea]|uniref:Uncharacterized protein n=1 Tax=Clitoria ternatea TaxID=43366 RepID=A0AAN9I8V8_CLITE
MARVQTCVHAQKKLRKLHLGAAILVSFCLLKLHNRERAFMLPLLHCLLFAFELWQFVASSILNIKNGLLFGHTTAPFSFAKPLSQPPLRSPNLRLREDAFGKNGRAASGDEGAVPPNASLQIDLELVSWKTVSDMMKDRKVLKKTLKEREGYERPNDGAVVQVKLIAQAYIHLVDLDLAEMDIKKALEIEAGNRDGSVPVSFIQKYLMKKLDLTSETEVEIKCMGQPVLPTLRLNNLVELWLDTTASTSLRTPQLLAYTTATYIAAK